MKEGSVMVYCGKATKDGNGGCLCASHCQSAQAGLPAGAQGGVRHHGDGRDLSALLGGS